MGIRSITKNKYCTYPKLLVVGRQVQGSRLCVQRQRRSLTGSVMWNMGGVHGQLQKRVRVAWVLFRNEPLFLVEGLDVKLFVRVEHIWVAEGLK
jgi:hypothetical protein